MKEEALASRLKEAESHEKMLADRMREVTEREQQLAKLVEAETAALEEEQATINNQRAALAAENDRQEQVLSWCCPLAASAAITPGCRYMCLTNRGDLGIYIIRACAGQDGNESLFTNLTAPPYRKKGRYRKNQTQHTRYIPDNTYPVLGTPLPVNP